MLSEALLRILRNQFWYFLSMIFRIFAFLKGFLSYTCITGTAPTDLSAWLMSVFQTAHWRQGIERNFAFSQFSQGIFWMILWEKHLQAQWWWPWPPEDS
jgi:hypothetical protein